MSLAPRIDDIEIGKQDVLGVAYIKEVQAPGIFGQTSTAAGWNKCVLNELTGLNNSFVTLSFSQVILQPGKYFIKGRTQSGYDWVSGVIQHKAKNRFRNVDSGTTVINGGSFINHISMASGQKIIEDFCELEGFVEALTTTTFELQHYFYNSGTASYHAGYPVSAGENEVYSQLKIVKVA